MSAPRRSPALLHVLSTTDHRGAEVFGVRLDAALAAKGWTTRVVALAPGGQAPRLAVDVLGSRSLGPATLGRLRRAAAGHVVIAHGSSALPACALATAGAAPFLYRNIGDPSYWAGSPARRLRVLALLRRSSAVVALSEPAAAVLRARFGVRRDRLFVIPNAVPLALFPVADEQRRAEARSALGIVGRDVVAYVGALSAEKNVGAAIDAVSGITGAQLVVQGDGPDRAVLERRAHQRAPGRVRFLGSSGDSASVLAAADVVVLPSHTEGMPAVLIEAAFTGIPVVATDVGGVATLVRHQETGLLVPPGDTDALASALRTVLRDPGGMGQSARAYCGARFDLANVVPLWEEVLLGVAGRMEG